MNSFSPSSPAQPRLTDAKAAEPTWNALLALQQTVNRTSLDASLRELVALRASQINGCAYCLDLHTRRSLERGERADRLYLLNAWQDVAIYSPRERAALRYAETLTRLSDGTGVPDDVFAEARAHFTEAELLELTLAVIVINSWNRLNVAFRVPPEKSSSP